MADLKNIFITGGAGFIGSHLIEVLTEQGFHVKIYDNLHRNSVQYTKILEHENVTFVQGDILDAAQLTEEMKGMDMIIHLAAIAGVSNYHNFPAKTLRVNLIGTFNLLEAMQENKIKRIIDLSTSEIFGTEVIDVDESSYFNIGPPADRRWSYAASKIGGEQLIYRFSEEYDWNSTIIRPFNIYGPRQTGEGAISNFCKKVLTGENLLIEGSGSASRSWCYIDDFIRVLAKIVTEGHKGIEVFNIGNPRAIATTYNLAEIVLRHAQGQIGDKMSSQLELVPMEYTETKVRYPNISKVQKSYSWTPEFNLEEGINRTLKWFIEAYEEG